MSRLLKIALSQYGVKEVPGIENNPEIMKYFKEIGHTWVQSEETAWCSAFMNWCAMQKNFEGSDALDARSWLKVGKKVEFKDADVCVLWRVSRTDWRGHIMIPVNVDDNYIWGLGGNQSNMVRISAYPKDRLLAYIKLYPT